MEYFPWSLCYPDSWRFHWSCFADWKDVPSKQCSQDDNLQIPGRNSRSVGSKQGKVKKRCCGNVFRWGIFKKSKIWGCWISSRFLVNKIFCSEQRFLVIAKSQEKELHWRVQVRSHNVRGSTRPTEPRKSARSTVSAVAVRNNCKEKLWTSWKGNPNIFICFSSISFLSFFLMLTNFGFPFQVKNLYRGAQPSPIWRVHINLSSHGLSVLHPGHMARYFHGDKPQPHPIQSATSTAGCDRAAWSPAAAAACVLCASSDLPCRKMAADDPGGASAPPLGSASPGACFSSTCACGVCDPPPCHASGPVSRWPFACSSGTSTFALAAMARAWRDGARFAPCLAAHGRQFRIIPRNTSAVVSLPLLAGYLEARGRL